MKRAKLDMDSQNLDGAALEQVKGEEKKAAEERKVAETLKLKKDNVWQLTDDFLKLVSLECRRCR